MENNFQQNGHVQQNGHMLQNGYSPPNVHIPQTLQEDNTGFDFKKLVYIFLQHWLWFAAAIFLCLLSAFLYLRYTTPVYKINSKILIKDDKGGQAGSSEDLLSQLDIFNTKNNVNNEKEVLQTHYLVKKAADELQLNVNCFAVGNIKSTELYKNKPFQVKIIYLKDSIPAQTFNLAFSKDGTSYTIEDDSSKTVHHFNDTIKTSGLSFVLYAPVLHDLQNNNYRLVINTLNATTEKYLQNLNFEISDKLASVIKISLQETVPAKGEDMLNKLYQVYTRMNEEDKNKIADSTINFIDERLAVVSGELSGVEKDIERFKVQNRLSTDFPEQSRLALNNASDVQKQLTQQDVEIDVVESIQNHLNTGRRVVPNAGVIQDPTYLAAAQQYNQLVLERDRQLQTTKPDNPIIQNLNSQIDAVKNNLQISLGNIKKDMQISRQELSNKNNQFISEIKTGPAKERAFLDISRQQDVKQQLYLYLLQKREETAISKSGTLSNSRLIEPAISDAQPFMPKKSSSYLIALFTGFLVPAGFIYLKNLMNNTISSTADITKETSTPVLAEIGHNSSGKAIVAEQNARTALSEQFRALRTNLQFLLKGKEQQIVMLTSSASGEGKSFLSANLASALAISNKKVVLMELDLRKPKISKELGMSNDKGFTDYLIGMYKKEEIIKPTTIHPNLFLISSGTIPPNPAELLLNKEVDDLFNFLKTKFDYIIVDTPPVGVVIDAVLLNRLANASIYVVRQKYTLKHQLQIVNDFKQNGKLPNLSLIVNDVQISKGYGYGYRYGGYHYGYGYGYTNGSDYYSDSKKAKRGLFKTKIKA